MGHGIRLIVMLLSVTLAACSSTGGDNNGAGSSATPVLAGDPAQQVSAVLQDTDAGPVAPSDIVQGHLLTRLFVALNADATVGQVNAAAAAVGATAIAFSMPDSLLLTLQIPRQAGIGDLHRLADILRTQPGILLALPAREFKTSVLPELTPGQPVSPLDLSHLRPTRFPQAWNARGAGGSDCLPRSVPVYIWDKFGDSGSRPTFFNHIDSNGFVFDDVGGFGDVSGHGFDVAMTLGAKFDAQKPTGANPFKDCLVIHEIEAFGRDMSEAAGRAWIAVEGETDNRFILNVSMNFPDPLCGPNGDQVCDAQTILTTPVNRLQDEIVGRAMMANGWALLVGPLNLGQRMLITLSAGNIDPGPNGFLARNYIGFGDATFSSPVSLATELGEVKRLLTSFAMWRSADPALPDITFSQEKADDVVQQMDDVRDLFGISSIGISADNLQIVRSVTNGETLADISDSDFNFSAPFGRIDIKAVGEDISLPDAPAVPIELQEGTSFAAPQVAGLASYLWVLDDGLRNRPVKETIKLIGDTSRSSGNAFGVIDAYGAVLALDQPNGPQRIRKALLDVNDDGFFDGLDLLKYQEAYQLTDPNRPTIPSARDYSRFDLNGDGFTGGILIEPFDLDVNGLDADGLPLINTVDRLIEGYQITFNEAALSDIQILCFYAYSPLYRVGLQNDPRSTILGPDHCVGAQMSALFPTQISTSANLDVSVNVPVANGQFAPAPNMLVNFTPTCATVNPTSGRTDANGAISTTVTPSTGCTSVSVNAVARADGGTAALAQTIVTASVNAAATSGNLSGQLTQNGNSSGGNNNGSFSANFSRSAFVTVHIDENEQFTVPSATGTFSGVNNVVAFGCASQTSFNGDIVSGALDPNTGRLRLTGSGTVSVSGTVPEGPADELGNPTCVATSGSTQESETVALLSFNIIRSSNGTIAAFDFNATETNPTGTSVTTTTGRLERAP